MSTSSIKIGCSWNKNHDFESMSPRCSHTSTMIGECMYVVGGGVVQSNRFVHSNEIWKIDFAAKTQSLMSVAGFEGRRGHSAVAFRNRFLVIFGGFKTAENHDVLSDDLVIIDTVTEEIIPFIDTTGQALHESYGKPSPRRGHMAARSGNRMLVMGGDHDGDILNWDNHFVYSMSVTSRPGVVLADDRDEEEHDGFADCSAGKGVWVLWRRREIQGSLPQKLSLAACVQTGSELLIFGGSYIAIQPQSFIVSSKISDSLFVFDVDTFELRNISGHVSYAEDVQGLTPRYCAAMAVVGDCFLVVFGGTTQQGEDLTDLLVLHDEKQSQCQEQQESFHSNSWRHKRLRCIRSGPCRSTANHATGSLLTPNSCPSPRNAMSLVAVDPAGGSPSLVLLGGGRYPNEYHGDMWTLNLLSSPVGEVWQHQQQLQQRSRLANPFDEYVASCFENKRHADVTLVLKSDDSCDGEGSQDGLTIPPPPPPPSLGISAHKIVLAAKSSFFRSLFDGGWAENSSCESGGEGSAVVLSRERDGKAVDMQRICLDARITPFRHVLQFLYTGCMKTEEVCASLQSTVDVLQCAAMLDVVECKAFCEKELAKRHLKLGQKLQKDTAAVDVDNAGDLMHLAYTADELVRLEQEAVFVLSIADTFHCEELCSAALEQVRVCRHVLQPTVAPAASATSCMENTARDTPGLVSRSLLPPKTHEDECAIVQYADYFDSLSPPTSARLAQALDPVAVLILHVT